MNRSTRTLIFSMTLAVAAIGATSAFAGSPAEPGQVTFNAGADFVSDYVVNGVSQTGGDATLQLYLEAEANGFYAGAWMSGVDFGGANGDDVELDLYLGYRNVFANGFYLDAGYARYYYNDTGDCCGELKLTGVIPVGDSFGIEGYVAYDPQSGNVNRSATLAFSVNDRLGISARFGGSDSYNNDYWDVGGVWAFNDSISAGVRYYGASTGDEGIVLNLSLATSAHRFSRLLGAPFGR